MIMGGGGGAGEHFILKPCITTRGKNHLTFSLNGTVLV